MVKNKTIVVKGTEIAFFSTEQDDYISLTDIAKTRENSESFAVINNWVCSRSTIEFIGLWEKLCNPNFKPLEFERFRAEAGSNYFVLSPQRWIAATNAIRVISKSGRYGGTFAHRDIAFEFASWISAGFKLYLITEFHRLKKQESDNLKLEWSFQRTLAKVNYHIHTDAIKENLIPKELSRQQIGFIYASEADLLNMALFGATAKQWREKNPGTKENLRDMGTIEQLVVLSNLESINAVLIQQGKTQPERLQQLNSIAITQMKSLLGSRQIKKLK
jgi:hypothetical protein